MITVEQQRDWVQQLMARETPNLPGKQPAWLDQLRQRARRAAMESPVLTRKHEAWRYTDTEGLLGQAFLPAPADESRLRALDISDRLLPGFDSYRLVFVDGRYVPWLSNIERPPEGLVIGGLRAVLASDPDSIATWFAKTTHHDRHVFSALNTALMNDGLVVHLDPGLELDRPIEVLYISSGNMGQIAMQPRNLIVLESGAKATLVERFLSLEQGIYFHNGLTEIALGEQASLEHIRIQDESRSAYHLSTLDLSPGRHSRYQGTTLAFGGAWARTEYKVDLAHSGADCRLNGLYLVGDRQLSDFHIDLRHSVPGCNSRERFRGILYGKGRAVFDGQIRVERQAQKSDAQLTNDNLLLTRSAEVDTKPQLEIYADDVKCSHGTTVGQLDPEQLFYLRSRGIDEARAKNLLCLGFAREIVDLIDLEPLRDQVIERLAQTVDSASGERG